MSSKYLSLIYKILHFLVVHHFANRKLLIKINNPVNGKIKLPIKIFYSLNLI